jgi:hypothetical protein
MVVKMMNKPDDKYLVLYKDKQYYLNEKLCHVQKISDATLYNIVQKHIQKLMIFEQMEETDDPQTLKDLSNIVTDIEFDLQELWGFPLDINFHRWYDIPKCSCPKMDNSENIGTKYRIISGACPIHGN